jgi:hypothetical protein
VSAPTSTAPESASVAGSPSAVERRGNVACSVYNAALADELTLTRHAAEVAEATVAERWLEVDVDRIPVNADRIRLLPRRLLALLWRSGVYTSASKARDALATYGYTLGSTIPKRNPVTALRQSPPSRARLPTTRSGRHQAVAGFELPDRNGGLVWR